MTKNRLKFLLVAIVLLLFCTTGFWNWNTTSAEKNRDQFSHRTRSHKKIKCNSCHKSPTSNWTRARGYPDVADYPDHDSCINCHRNDFFRGNRPTICAICHVNPSPRGKARFPFPLQKRSQEFETIFPHDVHQNIIASNENKFNEKNSAIGVAHFVKANFRKIADDNKLINGCAICHQTPENLPSYKAIKPQSVNPLAQPEKETFQAKAELFKNMPDNHASCFNCHYQGQKPIRSDCASCHRLTSPYFESKSIKRYSLKFGHLTSKHSKKDCTFCHVRITQTADLRELLKADVPLLTCSTSSCHGDELGEEIRAREKSIADKANVFQCKYCHTTDLGSYEIPKSHLEQ